MIRSYFKIAWRNIKKNKAYAIINILGLSLGISCSILIYTLVTYHLSFDNFHNNKDRIYRITTEWHAEHIDYSQGVPSPLGKAIRNEYTFAEKTARVIVFHNSLITLTGEPEIKKFNEKKGVAFVEPGFFDIFNFPLISGNQSTALAQPNSAIVTEKIARKYFGAGNAIGKTIRVANKIDFTITGILKDLPPNTSRKQEIYLSYQNLKERSKWLGGDSSWSGVNSDCQCFTLLKRGVSASQVNTALAQLVQKYYKGRDAKEWRFVLQPLSDIHFNANLDGYADRKYIWALVCIGAFLIITACVNFVNLSTAQALNRSKEIGIRKVMGSLRSQLFWQFIAETLLITLFAVFLSYGFSSAVLPWLNNLFESGMSLHLFNNIRLPVFLLLITVLVVFLAGSYPALILARFQPVMAIKSKLSQKHIGGFPLRRILVVTQFAISQLLIIGTIVIASQIHYSKNSDLGFNKDALVLLPVPVQDITKMNTMRNQLAALPGVDNISFCYAPPAAISNNTTNVRFDNRTEDEHWEINTKEADDRYLSTFGLKLAAGRNLYPSDTLREYLVNETFVRKLGLTPEAVLGKNLNVNDNKQKAPIVGVVKDFYNYSFHTEMSAVCIYSHYKNYTNCAIKVNGRNIKTTLAAFEKIWNKTFPDYLYSYDFLDKKLEEFYELDNIMLKLVQAFAFIAIFIGCLGLYGLVSFMAVRKTKEIGVRKVLGASVQNILWLFGKEFGQLLLIAFVIAAPLAWYVMHLYLQDFTYRIQIGAGIFLLAIGSSFIVAALTVGYRSARAALANPVTSLRSE